jgi:hypothetical protein
MNQRIQEKRGISLSNRIADSVDTALLTGRTINCREYAPFSELDGVRDCREFLEQVRRLLIIYVDLLVFQDEWRAKRPSERAIPPTSIPKEAFVNFYSIKRDLALINHLASEVINSYPTVRERYNSGEVRWLEDLLGCFVSIALFAKATVSGVTKVSKDAIRHGCDSDVPSSKELRHVAREHIRSCAANPMGLSQQDLDDRLTRLQQISELVIADWAASMLRGIFKPVADHKSLRDA